MRVQWPALMTTLFLATGYLSAQSPAAIKEYKQSYDTYPFSDPNPVPAFTKIYPYFRFDGFTDIPIKKEWKAVELENDYIKLTILPEIGGKIWNAVEKSGNRSFIYNNEVVKFRDVAMRGPWTSGGIEANYGIIGHTPNCATPVDYFTRTDKDGNVSCVIGVLDLLTRTNWSIEITLPKDKAYFTTKSLWHNGTAIEQPYYHWMNVGIKTRGNLEFIYPGTKYLGHEGEFADWPINEVNGKNIAFYEQNNFGGYKSYHVFGKHAPFFGAYWHHDNFGMARYSPRDEKAGKKIWIWGLSQQGMLWEKLLTDKSGQYAEVQSGRLFNQNAEKSTFTPFKHKSFEPYATDEWTEYWYPVMHTKGFVEANEYGALNIKYEEGWLKIYFSPAQSINDLLEVKDGDKIVFSKKISLAPLKVFADSVKVKINSSNLIAALGSNKLIYKSQPSANNINRPTEAPKDFDWNDAYGLYVAGKEFMDQRLYEEAETKLKASLQKNSNFLPALIKMAELQYRNMRYAESLELAAKALSIDTHDGAANYYYGLANAQLGNSIDAKDGFELASISTAYRSAAYTELSKLALKEKECDKALVYANKSLAFNEQNLSAYECEAIAYRLLNKKEEAEQAVKRLLLHAPLNVLAKFERYLCQPSESARLNITSLIQNEMPQETYLELAIRYVNVYCFEEAEKALQLAGSNALVDYWLAFLQFKQGKDFSQQLKKANQSLPDYIFPFRSETAEMLQWAIKQTDNWKPKYWLALICQNRNRIAESAALFREAGEPDYAPFYAARALSKTGGEKEQEADLIKACILNKNEWRYPKFLAEFYIKQQQYEKAAEATERFYAAHHSNYIIGMVYAKALLLNKQFRKCDQVLSSLRCIPFEGANESRELYREAKLMQACESLNDKNYKNALKLIAASRIWPERLGAGKPYEADIDERLEDWMNYYCHEKMGKRESAQASLKQLLERYKNFNSTSKESLEATLVTLWAIEKTSNKEKANEFLSEKLRSHNDNKYLLWVKAVFQNSKPELPENEKDASIRILEVLSKLQGL